MTEYNANDSTAMEARAKLRNELGAISGSDIDADAPVVFSLSLEGLEGTGKTWFALASMPLPVILVNFGDRSAIPLLYDITEERRKYITVYDIQAPSVEGWTLQSARESLAKLMKIITTEAPLATRGTFVLDGGSAWWQTMQQVFVEPKMQQREADGKKQRGGLEYMEANQKVRGMVSYLKSVGCYFAMTHKMKQDWDAQGPIPGRYSAARQNDISFMVEVIIEFFKVCTTCKAPDCQDYSHVGRVHKARLRKFAKNTSLEGLVLDNLDFGKLYKLYTGKDWTQPEVHRGGEETGC